MKKRLGPDIRIDTSNTFALQEQEELKSFQIVAPLQRVVFALGSVDTVGQEADQLGCRRAFLIAGPNTSRTPLYGQVRRALGVRCVGEFTGIRPHSLIPRR